MNTEPSETPKKTDPELTKQAHRELGPDPALGSRTVEPEIARAAFRVANEEPPSEENLPPVPPKPAA